VPFGIAALVVVGTVLTVVTVLGEVVTAVLEVGVAKGEALTCATGVGEVSREVDSVTGFTFCNITRTMMSNNTIPPTKYLVVFFMELLYYNRG
jgi:hypothetical protein